MPPAGLGNNLVISLALGTKMGAQLSSIISFVFNIPVFNSAVFPVTNTFSKLMSTELKCYSLARDKCESGLIVLNSIALRKGWMYLKWTLVTFILFE